MKVGLFGGTFDPPHIGHLVIADQALTALKLDTVWFVPVGQPTHKDAAQVSLARHRVAMTRLAIATHPLFRICEEDVERPGPHYSLTLLQLLRAHWPEHSWTFIIGEDSLADLPKWHQPAALLDLVRLAVAHRAGHTPDSSALRGCVPDFEARLADGRIAWVPAPLVDLSSTELRTRLAHGQSVRYLTPRPVADYAQAQDLYRDVT